MKIEGWAILAIIIVLIAIAANAGLFSIREPPMINGDGESGGGTTTIKSTTTVLGELGIEQLSIPAQQNTGKPKSFFALPITTIGGISIDLKTILALFGAYFIIFYVRLSIRKRA